jgi:hypothetical protein
MSDARVSACRRGGRRRPDGAPRPLSGGRGCTPRCGPSALAVRAPVGDPQLQLAVAQLALPDRRAAAPARPAVAPVHPELLTRAEVAGGGALDALAVDRDQLLRAVPRACWPAAPSVRPRALDPSHVSHPSLPNAKAECRPRVRHGGCSSTANSTTVRIGERKSKSAVLSDESLSRYGLVIVRASSL